MNFIPYGKQSIDEDDIDAVAKVLRSDFLTTGPQIEEFENILRAFTGAKYAVAVANGTAALHLASLALLSEKDRVLTTPNSFVATANSILYAGAEPVFCDISADGNLDLDLAEEMIKNLVAGQEAVVRTARSLFPVVEKASDEATADLLTQRIQLHEKTAWMLRSLLE